MDAVSATIAKYTSLVDGTMRLYLDLHSPCTDFCEVGATVGLAKLGDTSILSIDGPEEPTRQAGGANATGDVPRGTKHWDDLPPTQQCAIRCTEERFQQFMGATDEADCAEKIRRALGIETRAELNTNTRKASLWRQRDAAFTVWRDYG